MQDHDNINTYIYNGYAMHFSASSWDNPVIFFCVLKSSEKYWWETQANSLC